MRPMATIGISLLVYASVPGGMPTANAAVRQIEYQQWEDCLELSNATARLVVAPANGGRIVHFSRDNGPNFFIGGCQIDIGPELDYPPRHPSLWSGRYQSQTLGPLSVQLTSPEDEATGLQLVRVVELAPNGAGVTLRQSMKNIGKKEVAYCHWDRTMTGATYGFFPLNPQSRFPARWSIRRGQHRTFSYDGVVPSSPRVRIIDDLLITVPGNKKEKVAADSMAGWIAGFRDGWLYVKRFPVYPDGDYADGGNSVEFWVDAAGTRTEIEPLSPKVRLQPGKSYSFTERWDLQRVELTISSAEDIPKLRPHVERIVQALSK